MTKASISALAEAQVTRLRAKAKDSHREWFEIRNALGEGGEDPTVYIYAEIGDSCWGESVSASAFVREFAAIDSDRIQLHINSPGGDVWEGIAIANAIRSHRAHVVATVDAIAASAASFIACAADELVMARNSELMVHDAFGLCVGPAAEMREMADRLDTVSDNIASMYAEKAGGELGDWREIMRAETWYSASEAVEAGLADRVDEKKTASTEAKNKFDLSPFNHAGRAAALAPATRAHKPPATPADHTTPPEGPEPMASDRFLMAVRERIGVPADSVLDEDGILAALDETLGEQAAEPVPTATASAAALPAGAVIVDQARFQALEADSAELVKTRQATASAARNALIDEALTDGRIRRESADTWRASLAQDDEAGTTTNHAILAGLPKGSAVPVDSVAYTGGIEEATDDDTDVAAIHSSSSYTNWSK